MNIDFLFDHLKYSISTILNEKSLNYQYLKIETNKIIESYKILIDSNEKFYNYKNEKNLKAKENDRNAIISSINTKLMNLWIPFHNLISCECNLLTKLINTFESDITKYLLSYI